MQCQLTPFFVRILKYKLGSNQKYFKVQFSKFYSYVYVLVLRSIFSNLVSRNFNLYIFKISFSWQYFGFDFHNNYIIIVTKFQKFKINRSLGASLIVLWSQNVPTHFGGSS